MKRLLTFCIVLISLASSAQRLKYKELFPLLPGMTAEQAKYALKEYLQDDLDHPNANLRLAMIYEKNYKDADPLTDFAFAMANAEQAKIRFLKSKQLVDPREVDRNNEYYFPIFKTFDAKGKPSVPFLLVSTKITKGYDSADQFLQRIPPMYKNFTRSVNHYDRAVKLFAKISSDYLSPEDLYLLDDEKLEAQLSELKSSYDSSIYYLDQYIKLTKEYSIKGHNLTYKVKPVETYRLDGLITRINFLTTTVDLWDYGTWVDKTRKVIATEIQDLRTKVVKSNEKFDEVLNKIATSPTDQMPEPAKLDKQLVFKLNNFDRQSSILALMEYKNFKQHYDIQYKSKSLDTTFSDRNAGVFSALIYANRSADTLIKEFKARISPLEVNKHKEFVTRFYGGQPGLEKYATAEQQAITSSFEDYSAQLRTNLLKAVRADEVFTNKEMVFKTGKINVPLTLLPDTAQTPDPAAIITRFNKKNPDGSAYIAGHYVADKKKNVRVAFLLRINPDGKMAWIKDLSVPIDSGATFDAHTYPTALVLTQEGCALMVRSVHASRGDKLNTFYYLNEKGEEKFKKKITETFYPRFINYSEKNNSFVIVLKGNTDVPDYTAAENIVVLGINVLGDVLWKREILLTGTIVDLVNLIDGYLIAGNFLVMRDQNGKEIRTRTNAKECSPYIIKLNERGEVLVTKPLVTPQSVYLQKVVKVSDNSINLMGVPATMESAKDKPLSSIDTMVHIMANKNGEVIAKNY